MGDNPGIFNQALMELGALVCLPRNPQCPSCPMNCICSAWNEGVVDAYPFKSKKKAPPIEQYIVLILLKEGSIWMEKRPEKGLLAGLWGFPLIPGIDVKGLREKSPDQVHAPVRHVFTHRVWEMKPVIYSVISVDEFEEYMNPKVGKFIAPKDLENLPIASAFRKILNCLT